MVIKKALPRAPVVLSVEERRQVVKYVELLVAVAKRAKAKRANIRYSKNQRLSTDKRKSSEEKGTRLKQKQENKVRKICGPCFLNQIIYSENRKFGVFFY